MCEIIERFREWVESDYCSSRIIDILWISGTCLTTVCHNSQNAFYSLSTNYWVCTYIEMRFLYSPKRCLPASTRLEKCTCCRISLPLTVTLKWQSCRKTDLSSRASSLLLSFYSYGLHLNVSNDLPDADYSLSIHVGVLFGCLDDEFISWLFWGQRPCWWIDLSVFLLLIIALQDYNQARRLITSGLDNLFIGFLVCLEWLVCFRLQFSLNSIKQN